MRQFCAKTWSAVCFASSQRRAGAISEEARRVLTGVYTAAYLFVCAHEYVIKKEHA